jgi:acyl carrier protein
MSDIQERLAALVIRKFGAPAGAVTPDVTLEQIGFDSLALIELALSLQEEFGAQVGDDELSSSDRLVDVADLVAGKAVAVP